MPAQDACLPGLQGMSSLALYLQEYTDEDHFYAKLHRHTVLRPGQLARMQALEALEAVGVHG